MRRRDFIKSAIGAVAGFLGLNSPNEDVSVPGLRILPGDEWARWLHIISDPDCFGFLAVRLEVDGRIIVNVPIHSGHQRILLPFIQCEDSVHILYEVMGHVSGTVETYLSNTP